MTNDEETMLVFAMRYAIPRSTGAGAVVAREILSKWESVSFQTKQQIHKEVTMSIGYEEIPTLNRSDWEKVLSLNVGFGDQPLSLYRGDGVEFKMNKDGTYSMITDFDDNLDSNGQKYLPLKYPHSALTAEFFKTEPWTENESQAAKRRK